MKLAFGGPSGSGKTTLASMAKVEFHLRQIQSFETRQFPPHLLEEWEENYGYQGNVGHKKLIQLQNEFPEFGVSWQLACTKCRARVISNTDDFVMDRSPVDNVVYFLLQVSHNATPELCEEVILAARESYKALTHFVRIRVTNQDSVETNGSRVDNIYYQQMVSSVFDGVFDRYFSGITSTKVLVLDTWDLPERKNKLREFLRGK